MELGDNGGVRKSFGAGASRTSLQDEKFRYKFRDKILWQFVDPYLISRLYGFTLQGLDGEEAKEMLKARKVWPYYYPDPLDPTDLDRYPVELSLDQTKYFRVHIDKEEEKKKRKHSKLKNSATEEKKAKHKKKKRKKHSKAKKFNVVLSFFKKLRFKK